MDYGILSIIPAVLAIVLAMITKNIVISPDRGLPGNDPHAHFHSFI